MARAARVGETRRPGAGASLARHLGAISHRALPASPTYPAARADGSVKRYTCWVAPAGFVPRASTEVTRSHAFWALLAIVSACGNTNEGTDSDAGKGSGGGGSSGTGSYPGFGGSSCDYDPCPASPPPDGFGCTGYRTCEWEMSCGKVTCDCHSFECGMPDGWMCSVPAACADASANDAGDDAPADSSGDAADGMTDGNGDSSNGASD